MMRKLNDKQRQLFNRISKWCDDKARDPTVPPFHIFLTGGVGTGKSQAQKAFVSMTESSDNITVLLVADTGTAAFNISGETICAALKISPKSPKDYRPLSEESLNTLRSKYHHMQLLIDYRRDLNGQCTAAIIHTRTVATNQREIPYFIFRQCIHLGSG